MKNCVKLLVARSQRCDQFAAGHPAKSLLLRRLDRVGATFAAVISEKGAWPRGRVAFSFRMAGTSWAALRIPFVPPLPAGLGGFYSISYGFDSQSLDNPRCTKKTLHCMYTALLLRFSIWPHIGKPDFL